MKPYADSVLPSIILYSRGLIFRISSNDGKFKSVIFFFIRISETALYSNAVTLPATLSVPDNVADVPVIDVNVVAPAIPTPPNTTSAPVAVLVDAIVLLTTIFPPVLMDPPTPIPPIIRSAPVAVLVDAIVLLTTIFPPVLMDPPTPIPPVITSAPVAVLVDMMLPTTLFEVELILNAFSKPVVNVVDCIFLPINTFPPIPTPPRIRTAPVAVLVDIAVL